MLKGFLPRVMGLETEYGLVGHEDGEHNWAAASQLERLNRHPRRQRMWFANGDCFYVDVGEHPEYCTAECLNGYQVAAHDRVGEQRLRKQLQTLEQFKPNQQYWLYKNNVSENGNRYGSHENYLLPRSLELRQICSVLTPFLVSRIIWTGAGMVVPRPVEEGGWYFNLTQSAGFLTRTVGSEPTRDRAIFDTRDEPLADERLYRRQHLILGDSNLLFAPLAMRFEITSLLLLMLENGAIDPVRLSNPVRALSQINRNWAERVETSTGEKAAWQIQQEYFDAAATFVQRHGLEAYEVALAWWWQVIAAFRDDAPQRLVGQVDWVTKHSLVQASQARRGELDYAAARSIDMAYHLVHGEQAGLADKVRAKYEPAAVARQVAEALAAPPSSRAQLRSCLMEKMEQRGLGVSASWDHFRVSDETTTTTALLLDPFATDETAAEKRLMAPFLL